MLGNTDWHLREMLEWRFCEFLWLTFANGYTSALYSYAIFHNIGVISLFKVVFIKKQTEGLKMRNYNNCTKWFVIISYLITLFLLFCTFYKIYLNLQPYFFNGDNNIENFEFIVKDWLDIRYYLPGILDNTIYWFVNPSALFRLLSCNCFDKPTYKKGFEPLLY